MMTLLEVGRSVSSFRSRPRLRRGRPAPAAAGKPPQPQDALAEIGEEIGRTIAEPFFRARTWTEIEDSWETWCSAFQPLAERLFRTIVDAIQADDRSQPALQQASRDFFKTVSEACDEPLRTTFSLSIRTIRAADRLAAENRERIAEKITSESDFRSSFGSILTEFTLGITLVSCWIFRRQQGDETTADQLDFAVLAVKRSAASYYMAVRRMIEN